MLSHRLISCPDPNNWKGSIIFHCPIGRVTIGTRKYCPCTTVQSPTNFYYWLLWIYYNNVIAKFLYLVVPQWTRWCSWLMCWVKGQHCCEPGTVLASRSVLTPFCCSHTILGQYTEICRFGHHHGQPSPCPKRAHSNLCDCGSMGATLGWSTGFLPDHHHHYSSE